MGNMLKLIWWAVIRLFRSRTSLEAEILTLRHQLNVLRRKSPKRLAFSNFDRLVFADLYWIAPGVVNALLIVEPETVIRWHRAGFRLSWRWKSRARGGRPKVSLEIRQLIRAMSLANPLWGAPRIHGELLKLGICTITTARGHMRRCRVLFRLSGEFSRRQFSADYSPPCDQNGLKINLQTRAPALPKIPSRILDSVSEATTSTRERIVPKNAARGSV